MSPSRRAQARQQAGRPISNQQRQQYSCSTPGEAGWAGSAAGFWPGKQLHIPHLVPGFAFGISQPVEGVAVWSALGDDQDRCTRPANPPKLLTIGQHNQIAGGRVPEVWGHRCTVETHRRLAVKLQPAPEQAEQGQPQVDCSMDRQLGGSVFVSPLAQFSMSSETWSGRLLKTALRRHPGT